MLRRTSKRTRVTVSAVVLALAVGALTFVLVVADDDPSGQEVVLTDDFSLAVPDGWDDIERAPLRTSDAAYPYVQAAPDLDAYQNTADGPGLEAVLVDGLGHADVESLLEATIERLDAARECAPGPRQPFAERSFRGVLATYRDCGTAGSELWLLVAATPDDERVAVLGMRGGSEAERERAIEALTQPE